MGLVVALLVAAFVLLAVATLFFVFARQSQPMADRKNRLDELQQCYEGVDESVASVKEAAAELRRHADSLGQKG